MNLVTPKLGKTSNSTLYPYYAGYSYDFVHKTLSNYVNEQSVILDPWSGTGLTSITAKQFGCNSIGIDVNPVMTVIAKANNISSELSPSILSIKTDIINKFKYIQSDFKVGDGLNLWFDHNSTGLLRSFEKIIYKLLVCVKTRDNLLVDESQLSSLASFFYVALFNIVKKFVKQKFSTSNPTWIKVAKNDNEKISITKLIIIDKFNDQIDNQVKLINDIVHFNTPHHLAKFITANSKQLPIKDNSVDYILTSPPYCTRIDYAISMRPELAVLGVMNDVFFKNLRFKMTGSPVIRKEKTKPSPLWGEACNVFLTRVREHTSIASKKYYYTNLLQYFDDIYTSFNEISRVCKKGANFSIVVQDSFYKELHNNLPLYFEEMLSNLNFKKDIIVSFKSNSFSNINSKSSKYIKTKKNHEFFINFNYKGN